MVGRRSFPIGEAYFQGQTVSGREGTLPRARRERERRLRSRVYPREPGGFQEGLKDVPLSKYFMCIMMYIYISFVIIL